MNAELAAPDHALPQVNRRVLLRRRPTGVPHPEDFALDEAPLEPLGEGQFRIRNHYLSVDPAQRGWASAGANYSPPVPLGGVMRALAVGQVVESRNADFSVGAYAYGWFGWQLAAVAERRDVLTSFSQPRAPLSAYAGVLGINGMTAELALHRLGRPQKGDVVLVSTAAGAVGSVVGQLARAAGCRVTGLTGSDAKATLCTERFGYHDAANYRAAPMPDLLARLAPDGVDVFFDNVGGEILDHTMRAMRPNGRIVQCGTASVASWSPAPAGPRNEREVLTRRVCWSGFVIFDHAEIFSETLQRLEKHVQAGLSYEEDIRDGIDNAPAALADVFAGRNCGKTLIRVIDPITP